MQQYEFIPLILIAITGVVSYKGFTQFSFFNRYKFEIDRILIGKEYIRLISSGFLHGSWQHFAFNMFTLWLFSDLVLIMVGVPNYLFIYLGSMLGGSLVSLVMHRNHGDYSAIGASGAVSGMVFATIIIAPYAGIGIIFIPIKIKAWIFGVAYLSYSLYNMFRQKDNIGHDAHLGGAITGVLMTAMILPDFLFRNAGIVFLILAPVFITFLLLMWKPELPIVGFKPLQPKNYIDQEHKYSELRAEKQNELDRLLEKIAKKGYDSLSEYERKRLEELSG